jgi:hypothetical protein
MGLAMVASLTTSLVGVSVPHGIPSAAAQCAVLPDCDDEPVEAQGQEELDDSQNGINWYLEVWAEEHLAAEYDEATWWRVPIASDSPGFFFSQPPPTDPPEGQRRGMLRMFAWGDAKVPPYLIGGLYIDHPNLVAGARIKNIRGDVLTTTLLLEDGTHITQLADGTYTSFAGWSAQDFIEYDCDPNYDDAQSGGCVPADRDYDCGELRSWGIANIPVIGEDWMLLDDDGDGLGCEPIVEPVTLTPEPTKQCDGILGMLGCFLGR